MDSMAALPFCQYSDYFAPVVYSNSKYLHDGGGFCGDVLPRQVHDLSSEISQTPLSRLVRYNDLHSVSEFSILIG